MLLVLCPLVFTSLCYSQMLVENFSYASTGVTANDTLTNPSIGGLLWKKHSGNGTPIVWSATGLTYAGYAGSGIGGAVSYTNGAGSREDANIALSDSIKSGSVYLSFMINVTASGGTVGDYNVHLSSSAGNGAGSLYGRVFIKDGVAANTFKLGLSKAGAAALAVFTTADYNFNQTYLVVVKYTFNSLTNIDDVASAYIFSAGVPSVEPVVADLVATDMAVNDIAKVYGVCIRQGTSGTAAAILDGFVVGTSWLDAPLPVKLTSFTAVGLKEVVNVNWGALCNSASCKFNIERSVDGISFETVNTVNGKINANSYTISDKNLPKVNTLYYRIKTINADGKFDFSYIQKVKLNDVKLVVSPNPVSNELMINANGTIKSVELLDFNGKTVLLHTNLSTNSIKISLASFKEGAYIVKTIIGGEISTNKIVVKH